MAAQQMQRHELGREGQAIVRELAGGRQQRHKAPFDVVDFSMKAAYEVKTMSAMSKDLKVHISKASWDRKMAFVARYGVHPYLMAVVIHAPDKVEVYRSELYQSIRVGQMEQIR